MKTSTTPSGWDSENYWKKARAYVAVGRDQGAEHAAFRYALALEFLARAALTKVHPALNAHPNDDGVSLLHAFGIPVAGQPKSVEMKAVYARLGRIAPDKFTPTLMRKCEALAAKRNEELHTADLASASLKGSAWLSSFYEAVGVLCSLLGRTMEDFFGKEEAAVAQDLVDAQHGKQISSTRAAIKTVAKAFKAKPQSERRALKETAEKTPGRGKRTKCPACGSTGRVNGRVIRQSAPTYGDDDGQVTIEETCAADAFACVACGLSLQPMEAVLAAGIEPTFTMHATWDPRDDWPRDSDYPGPSPEYENM